MLTQSAQAGLSFEEARAFINMLFIRGFAKKYREQPIPKATYDTVSVIAFKSMKTPQDFDRPYKIMVHAQFLAYSGDYRKFTGSTVEAIKFINEALECREDNERRRGKLWGQTPPSDLGFRL